MIAMRVHISEFEWRGQQPGYSASNLSIGQEQTLYRYNWLTSIGTNATDWIDRALVILLGFVALVLWASQRRQTVYLWIFAVGALVLLETPLQFITTFHNVPVIWELIGSLPRVAGPFHLGGTLLRVCPSAHRVGVAHHPYSCRNRGFYVWTSGMVYYSASAAAGAYRSPVCFASFGGHSDCADDPLAAGKSGSRPSSDTGDSVQLLHLCSGGV